MWIALWTNIRGEIIHNIITATPRLGHRLCLTLTACISDKKRYADEL
jgi:hypothetical protein